MAIQKDSQRFFGVFRGCPLFGGDKQKQSKGTASAFSGFFRGCLFFGGDTKWQSKGTPSAFSFFFFFFCSEAAPFLVVIKNGHAEGHPEFFRGPTEKPRYLYSFLPRLRRAPTPCSTPWTWRS